jgi:TBC1 domain family protein 5
MPENLYFREPTTQTYLLDILFIYCKLNADIGYRQGMHEVLAPILWVVSRDTIDPADLDDRAGTRRSDDGLVSTALDHSYVEHDAFNIFCAVMQTAKSFYELGISTQQSAVTSPLSSPIVERSKRIHEDYLRKTDPELAEHLTAIDILPQIFIM